MGSKKLLRFIPVLLFSAFLIGAPTGHMDAAHAADKAPAAAKKDKNVYKGKILGKSNKAKTISIEVGKGDAATTKMVKFDDQTTGLEFAQKDEAAIINWEQRGTDKYATAIKPKLAKLPEGVTEIKTDELHGLLEKGTALTLVDARPESRYDQAHLPGAINIPVPKLKKMKGEVLPKDKDMLLVFYCGGPT